MPEPSTSPTPTGNPASAEKNDTSQQVEGAPTWWHPATIPKQVQVAKDYLMTFTGPAAKTVKPVTGVLLWGPPGTGKTAASVAVAYEWGKAGHYARFQDFGELMVSIRSAWRKDANRTVEEIHGEMFKPDFLVLDDVGKRATPEDQETLGILVNGRLNRGKKTILTTNCLMDTDAGRREFLAACDSRVLERYSEQDMALKGNNLRRTNANH